MDFQQHTQPETQTEQNPEQNQQMPKAPAPNPTMNQDAAATQPIQQQPATDNTDNGQPPHGNDDREPYQSQQSYGNGGQTPYQNQQQYENDGRAPYQSRPPYGNNARPPYRGGNPYQNGNAPYGNPYNSYNNNNNPNSYQNGYPYYNRNTYQLPYTEPGSNFANAAMVLGIISIISCFTFTVYPAFILGSIAIVLALLSKGSRPKLPSKARTGVTCAVIGLVTNTILLVSAIVLLFTSPALRKEVNRTFEKQYGISFDEMMEEILEESGISYE